MFGKNTGDALLNLWTLTRHGKEAHNFCLNEEWKQNVQEWSNGRKIGGFRSREEMHFIGYLIHNSIPRCFYYDYKQFLKMDKIQLKDMTSSSEVTLILIVENNEVHISAQDEKSKILYFVLGSDADEEVNVKLFALDEKSQIQLRYSKLVFMGNEVSAVEIFGEDLLQELPVWTVYDFKQEESLIEKINYCDQAISNENTRIEFKSATAFAQELKKGNLKFVVISSDAGMGKSTALKQIAKTLQEELQCYWIVHINLFRIQKELHQVKSALTSENAAVELVKNVVLQECINKEILAKVFNRKVEAQQMVLLFDSLDEVCPIHRETADKLITLLRETQLQIVVTTRPHEGKSLRAEQTFKLELLTYWKMKIEFIRQQFESLKKKQPDDLEAWFRRICGSSINVMDRENKYFWSIPLSLVMAVYTFNAELVIKAGSELQHKADIYDNFLRKSIKDTLDDKMELKKETASMSEVYEEQIEKYNILIQILATFTIFNEGKVTERFKRKIAKNGVFINRFVVAKLFDGNQFVSFMHRSYAEHLVARLFVQQLASGTDEEPILVFDQLQSILMDERNSEIRQHICGILAADTTLKLRLSPDVIKEGGERKLIELLIEDDLYEIYQQLKEHLHCAHDHFVMVNDNGETINMLYLALRKARKDFVQDLLNDGAKIENILNEKFVLQFAVKHDLYDLVQRHIKSLTLDINQDEEQNDICCPLFYAARNGSKDMAKLLIENGALIQKQTLFYRIPLFIAIRRSSNDVIDLLLERGADLTNYLSYAFLHFNRIEIFHTIYSQIPDELKEEHLTDTLTDAAFQGNLDTCKYLCNFNANPTYLDSKGETSIHRAAAEGHLECIQYLLEKQQSVDMRNLKGETPLMVAIRERKENVVQWLLDQKADVNAVDRNGKTCLHAEAALYFDNNRPKKFQCHKLLVNAGAEIDAKDNMCQTALFVALNNGNEDIASYLLENSANPDLLDNEGNTCLHHASKSGSLKCVKLIAERMKTLANHQNHNQETPLHLVSATQQTANRIDIISTILERGPKLPIEKYAYINVVDKEGKSCLHYAAEVADFNCVELLVSVGAEINARDNKGRPALFYALKKGRVDIVKFLLEYSSNDLTDNEGNTCLHFASESKSLKCLKLLEKTRVNCLNSHQQTPLHFAFKTSSNSATTVAFLLEKGADPTMIDADGRTCLHLAAGKGHFQSVKSLIEHRRAADDAGNSTALDIGCRDNNGWTALFYASKQGKSDIVKYVLGKGADPKIVGADGNTCLHLASSAREGLECVKLFVEYLPVNIQNIKRETPLHLASASEWKKSEDIVAFLLQKGADPNIKDAEGRTSLHLRAKEGFFESMQIMIEKNACVNAVDKEDKTSLHYAASAPWNSVRDQAFHCVELLVFSGANIDAKDSKGWTALFYSSQKGHIYTVNYLLMKSPKAYLNKDNEGNTCLHVARSSLEGIQCVMLFVDRLKISVDSKNGRQETPLHLVSLEGHDQIVAFLLKRGADPNIQNVDGQTSLHMAARGGHLFILQLLIEKIAVVTMEDKNGETPLALAERLGNKVVAKCLRSRMQSQ